MILLSESGFTLKDIQQRLNEEDISVSRTALCLLIKKYNDHGTVRDLRWFCRPASISDTHLWFMEAELASNSVTATS